MRAASSLTLLPLPFCIFYARIPDVIVGRIQPAGKVNILEDPERRWKICKPRAMRRRHSPASRYCGTDNRTSATYFILPILQNQGSRSRDSEKGNITRDLAKPMFKIRDKPYLSTGTENLFPRHSAVGPIKAPVRGLPSKQHGTIRSRSCDPQAIRWSNA
jgi:hypothetical protein